MTLNAADKTRFLQALDDDPEFLQQVRLRLLSADLLELPERFAVFVNHVNGFIAEQREHNANFNGFIAEQRETNENFKGFIAEQRETNENFRGFIAEQREHNEHFNGFIAEQREHNRTVDRRLNRMDGRMDNGLGFYYEVKVARNFGSIAGRDLGMRRVRLLHSALGPADGNLSDLIADAEDRGALTAAEANDLLATDLVARGRRRDTAHDVYVAVEASITVGDQDIERAAERAGYLAKVVGEATEPAVVGESIGPEQAELARRRQVTVMLLPSAV